MSEVRLSNPAELKLGMRVRDLVSGYIGIATRRLDFLNGCIQYAVEGSVQEGKTEYPFYSIDWNQLAIVDNGLYDAQQPQPGFPDTGIKLGMTLKDKITGFSGIATYSEVFMNGAIKFAIQPKMKEGDATTTTNNFDWFRLEFIDNGIYVPAEKTQAQKDHTGGPSMRLHN